MKRNEDETEAFIRSEVKRTVISILTRTERPAQMWWMSFAFPFLGACIVHALDSSEALSESWMHGLNPGGECQMIEIPLGTMIPEEWKYRLLSLQECTAFEDAMRNRSN